MAEMDDGFLRQRRNLFSRKDKDINLLDKYKTEEGGFDEEALFSEFEEENKKHFLPFVMLTRTLKLWWIPFFIIKFSTLLVWRSILLIVFRRRVC